MTARLWCFIQEAAQFAHRRCGTRVIALACKRNQAPPAIRCQRLPQLHQPAIADAHHQRRMKTCTNHQACGQMLVCGHTSQQRWRVTRSGTRCVAAMPHEILLNLQVMQGLTIMP